MRKRYICANCSHVLQSLLCKNSTKKITKISNWILPYFMFSPALPLQNLIPFGSVFLVPFLIDGTSG